MQEEKSEKMKKKEHNKNVLLFLGASTVLIFMVIAYICYNNANPPINYEQLAKECWTENIQKSFGDNANFKGTKDIRVTNRVSGVEGDMVVSGTLIGTKKDEEDVTINFIKTNNEIKAITTDHFYDTFTSDVKEFIENNDEEKSKEKKVKNDYMDILNEICSYPVHESDIPNWQINKDTTIDGGTESYKVVANCNMFVDGVSKIEQKHIILHIEYFSDGTTQYKIVY